MKPLILMLAYNTEKTLAKTYQALPDDLKPYVIVGDNCSTDRTNEVARSLGLRVVRHERNLNYGGNLKKLFRIFLDEGADIAIEIHSDFQYEPSLADLMIEYINRGFYDVIQGNRIRSRRESLAGGMPLYRYLGNRTLTLSGLVRYSANGTVGCARIPARSSAAYRLKRIVILTRLQATS